MIMVMATALKRNQGTQGMENNVVASQPEYFLIFSLSSSSPPNQFDSWLVESGASRHFTRYREFLSKLVERDTNLKTILGDNCTYRVKGFGYVSFHDYGEIVHLHDVMYILGLIIQVDPQWLKKQSLNLRKTNIRSKSSSQDFQLRRK